MTNAIQARSEVVHERSLKGARAVAANDEAVARLERFASTALQHNPPPARFALLQYVAGEGTSQVTSFDAAGAKARDVAHEAYELARHDAAGFAGVASYWLVVYPTADAGSYTDRCAFRVAANMMSDVSPSENPTQAGLTLQGMRHLEVMAFQYSEGMRNVLREKDLTISDLREDNQKLREERTMLIDSQMSVVKLREELADESSTRKLAAERERASLASKEKATQFFFQLVAPVLAKKLATWQGVANEVAAPAAPAPPSSPETPVAKSAKSAPRVEVAAPVVATPAPKPLLTPEACASVIDFVSSLDQPTFGRMIGILSDEQGTKLLALVSQLNADAGVVAPEAEAKP